ncbi:hypothetical protein WG66_000788, partial [Moniliophthora roreri]
KEIQCNKGDPKSLNIFSSTHNCGCSWCLTEACFKDWTRKEPIAKQKHFVNSKTGLEPPEKGTSDPSNLQAVNEMMTVPLAVDSLDLEGPPSIPGVWPFWMEG